MKSIAAEIIGTAALVGMGCGAIVVNDLYGGVLGHLGVCLSFGLIVMAMIYAIGNISGAHLNPAVTVGFFLAGRINARTALRYIGAQIAGALIGAVLLKILFPAHPTLGATIPQTATANAFFLEMLMTALLMFVILNVSAGHMEKGIMAGVAVGGTIMLEALVGGPLTGASMNPARSLGPAVVSMNFNYLWIYIAAPVLGAAIASPSCRFLQGNQCCYQNEGNNNG